jgi:hypothetical protein
MQSDDSNAVVAFFVFNRLDGPIAGCVDGY